MRLLNKFSDRFHSGVLMNAEEVHISNKAWLYSRTTISTGAILNNLYHTLNIHHYFFLVPSKTKSCTFCTLNILYWLMSLCKIQHIWIVWVLYEYMLDSILANIMKMKNICGLGFISITKSMKFWILLGIWNRFQPASDELFWEKIIVRYAEDYLGNLDMIVLRLNWCIQKILLRCIYDQNISLVHDFLANLVYINVLLKNRYSDKTLFLQLKTKWNEYVDLIFFIVW